MIVKVASIMIVRVVKGLITIILYVQYYALMLPAGMFFFLKITTWNSL